LSGTASAKTYTSIRYDDGAFYLTDLKLDDLEVKPSLASRAKLVAIRKAIETFLDDVEIELASGGNDEALDKLRDLRNTIGPLLRKTLDENLGKIPVYRLQGDAKKGAARLILKDISFTNDDAIATLSPAQAMIKIAGFIITAIVLALLFWEWVRLQRETEPSEADRT